jgi:hypothetical protein
LRGRNAQRSRSGGCLSTPPISGPSNHA